MMVIAGMKIFGYAPISGVRWAAFRSLAASARWTSAKFVVQYPNDSTNPSPNTIAIQLAPIGLVTCPTPVPCQGCSASPPRPLAPVTLAFSPSQPPTTCRPTSVMGIRAARMTKNCSTSL